MFHTAGQPCPITTAGVLGANISCTPPLLPAGKWPINIDVNNVGSARATTISYDFGDYGFNSPSMSMLGGFELKVDGYGFVPDNYNNTALPARCEPF